MTDKFDITNIDHWLARHNKKRPTLEERLEMIEAEFAKGNVSQQKRDYAIHSIGEVEKIQNSDLDPKEKIKLLMQQIAKDQKMMNQKKGG